MNKRKSGRRKRLEKKRMKRNNRNRQRNDPFRLEWITDSMFSLRFHDDDISKIFPSVTVEIMDDD
jgi:hypothetical protein